MTKQSVRTIALAALLAVAAAPVNAQVAAAAACAPDAKTANLDFTFKDLDGKDVTLSDYKGKVILLDFWATWCGPCKFEIPGFIELYTKYRSQGLQVLGFAVGLDDPVPGIKAYAGNMKMNYPVLLGEGRDDVMEAYGPIPGLPTTFIIDREGKVCRTHSGFTEKEKFEEEIKALL